MKFKLNWGRNRKADAPTTTNKDTENPDSVQGHEQGSEPQDQKESKPQKEKEDTSPKKEDKQEKKAKAPSREVKEITYNINLPEWPWRKKKQGNDAYEEHPPREDDDNSVFGYIFKHLEIFIVIGMGFITYSLFDTFTTFIEERATFLEVGKRVWFSKNLMFGLMGVEILLALATSYFRKHNEWTKSFFVTAIAFVIAYYNDLTIIEIFELMDSSSDALQDKLRLANWLIFGLSEITSYLMHSKGKKKVEVPPAWFQHYQNQAFEAVPIHQAQQVSTTPQASYEEPFSNAVGFQPKMQGKTKTRKSRGNSIDYNRVWTMHQNGMRNVEIARALKCSEGHVSRILGHLRKERS